MRSDANRRVQVPLLVHTGLPMLTGMLNQSTCSGGSRYRECKCDEIEDVLLHGIVVLLSLNTTQPGTVGAMAGQVH
jgi:hypothetical protein